MPRLRAAVALLALAWAVPAGAATYYVDQTAGNDRNIGTSPAAAWKNAPGMSSFAGAGTVRAGDTVYFDRADVWSVTGEQGLFLTGGVTYVGDSWGTGTRRAVISAGADLAAGIVRFRDHPTLETVFRGFEIDGNGKVTSGVDMNHAFFVSPLTGATKRVQDTEIHHLTARQAAGQYKYGLIVSNFGGAAGAVENVEVINVVVHDVPRDAICLYPGDRVPNSRIRNILIRGSEAYRTGQDPDYCCGAGILVKGFVRDAYIEFNYVHDVKGASVFVNGNETRHFGEGQQNIHIRHNILTNATGAGAIRIYDGPSGGDPKDIKVYGNLLYDSPRNGGLHIGSDLKHRLDLRVYNNTFYNAPVVIRRNRGTIRTFEFRNNIVYSDASPPLIDEGGDIRTHSNNIYVRPRGVLVYAGGLTFTSGNVQRYEPSASARRPAFSTTRLPTGFVGTFGVSMAPNWDGLRPTPGSFDVHRGTSLPAPYATSINSVMRPAGRAWDIGAYEDGGR